MNTPMKKYGNDCKEIAAVTIPKRGRFGLLAVALAIPLAIVALGISLGKGGSDE